MLHVYNKTNQPKQDIKFNIKPSTILDRTNQRKAVMVDKDSTKRVLTCWIRSKAHL